MTQLTNKPSVTASAPGKLMLTGSHAVVHGYAAVVTAVNQRLSVTVQKNGVDSFHLYAPDLGLHSYTKNINELGQKELPKAVRFIEMLYYRFLQKYPQQEGINVTTQSDFSASFGFGSSSAVTVAFAQALTALYDIQLTRKELFKLCYQAILDVQGVGSGFDIAAAIWGGTLYYVSPAKVVTPLPEAKIPLVVGYTGVKADTPTIVRIVNSMLKQQPEKIDTIFRGVDQASRQLKQALITHDWTKAGQALAFHQEQMSQLGVSSTELNTLITAAEGAGAIGATLSGAGGGDCMVALAPDNADEVAAAIAEAGGEVMLVQLQAPGVRVENKRSQPQIRVELDLGHEVVSIPEPLHQQKINQH